MSEYTSSIEGFQKAMEWTLNGPATSEDVQAYVNSTTAPGFYQVLNNKRFERDEHSAHIKEMREKVDGFKPKVEQFLRDGDQLAARLTGTITMGGNDIKFESFIIAEVDKESGKMLWLIERGVTIDQAST